MTRTRTIFALLLVVPWLLSADQADQKVKDQIIRILRDVNTKILDARTVEMHYTMKVKGADAPADGKGFYIRSGSNVHIKQLGTELYEKDKIRIVIDEDSRSVIVSDIKDDQSSSWSSVDMEYLVKKSNDVQLNDSGSVQWISMKFDAERYPFSKVILTIQNDLPSKVILHHESPDGSSGLQISSIEYSRIVLNQNIKNSEFNISHIISSDLKTLRGAYVNYKLHDLTVNK